MAHPASAMPHTFKPHGLNQQFNQAVFNQTTPTRMNDNNQQPINSQSTPNKMSQHPQELHGFYNQGVNYGTGSSSNMSNNFYMPHYTVSLLSLQPSSSENP